MIAKRCILAALVGAGLGACFNPPGGSVLFSCEPDGRSACPPGYECRADGCCHDVDTPDDANENACKLAPDGGTATDTGTASESGTADTETDSGSETQSGTEPATGSSADPSDDGTSSDDASSDSGSTATGDDAGTSDTSTGDSGSSTTAAT